MQISGVPSTAIQKYHLLRHENMTLRRSLANKLFCGETLTQVKSFKYLGVHVDDQLKWNLHVEHLCKKVGLVGNVISYLARLKHFVNESALKQYLIL